MPCCASGGTLSVPMSKPRYTAVESQATISPSKCRATAMRHRRLAGRGRAEDGDEAPGGGARQHAICLTTSTASSAEHAQQAELLAAGRGHCGVGDSLKKNVTVKNALSAG